MEHVKDLCKTCKNCIAFNGEDPTIINLGTANTDRVPWTGTLGANCLKLGYWIMLVTTCEAYEKKDK